MLPLAVPKADIQPCSIVGVFGEGVAMALLCIGFCFVSVHAK